jgi:hypothetical protein
MATLYLSGCDLAPTSPTLHETVIVGEVCAKSHPVDKVPTPSNNPLTCDAPIRPMPTLPSNEPGSNSSDGYPCGP